MRPEPGPLSQSQLCSWPGLPARGDLGIRHRHSSTPLRAHHPQHATRSMPLGARHPQHATRSTPPGARHPQHATRSMALGARHLEHFQSPDSRGWVTGLQGSQADISSGMAFTHLPRLVFFPSTLLHSQRECRCARQVRGDFYWIHSTEFQRTGV